MYLDKLDDRVNKDKNTNHSTIKMKPVDVKRSIYIDSSKEKNLKLPVLLEYPSWSEEVFVIKNVQNTVSWTYFISEIVGTFYEKEFQKTNQKEFRIEKVIKKKGKKLYVKWKG